MLPAGDAGTSREDFFAADVGISGVDYLVAETGSLVVVSGPGHAAPVVVPGTAEGVPYSSGAFPNLGGWWLASLDGIYLWTPRTGAFLVAETPAGPAGACA